MVTKIPVALSANCGFALPMAVTLFSLISSASSSTRLKVYLIGNDLHPGLIGAVRERVEVVQVPLPNVSLRLPERYPREALAPVFLDQVLDEERILFLDCDLLVMDDLQELWNTELAEHALAAAQDCAHPYHADGSSYFNCGVLLLDLNRWRRDNTGQRVLRLIHTTPCPLLHQSALNELYKNDWAELSPRWNLIAGLCGRPFTPPRLVEAVKDPGIAHFAGRFKPWRFRTKGAFAPHYEATLHQKPFGFHQRCSSPVDRLLSIYDLHFRDILYPLERFFWEKGCL